MSTLLNDIIEKLQKYRLSNFLQNIQERAGLFLSHPPPPAASWPFSDLSLPLGSKGPLFVLIVSMLHKTCNKIQAMSVSDFIDSFEMMLAGIAACWLEILFVSFVRG